ncbi:MAG: TIM barrel protein [Clostridia bacterium]|nr:TIM barrel protein [Clostridia bacterium]
MKLCVPIPCFFGDLPFETAVEKVATLGYKYVEIYDWRQLDPASAAKALDGTGVTMLSMCTTEFRLTDPACRDLWVDGIKESCAAAAALGVKKLITQVGPDTGEAREAQRRSIVEGLKAGAPILERAGVTVMVEPLNTKVDHPGYFLTSSAEAFELVREVGSPNVKVVFDIYHQQVSEGNIIPNITENLDCIAHLHAAGHPGRNELQFGENDYKNIFAAVDKAGFTGACGLEYRPLLGAEESLAEAMKIYGEEF